MIHKIVIDAIKKELVECRKFWRHIPQHNEVFIDTDHQRRYDALKSALTVIEEMGESQFLFFLSRAERQKQEAEKQTTLFK